MIINEMAGSGGDLMPYMFQRRKIGPLVGKRTWGGLVHTADTPPFIDGGSMIAPRGGFFTRDGKWAVENEGVAPDIDVENWPKEVIAGRDPQLERAVQEAMNLLKSEAARSHDDRAGAAHMGQAAGTVVQRRRGKSVVPKFEAESREPSGTRTRYPVKIRRVKRVAFVVAGLVAAAAAAFVSWNVCCAPAEDAPVRRAESAPRRSAPEPPTPSATAPAAPATSAEKPSSAPEPRRTRPTPPAEAAPSTEPTRVETATLRINSDVPGAQVFLNREFVGATPATARDLKPGSYQLNVAAPGFDNHVESIDVAAGERDITIRFREVKLSASIEVVHKHRFGSCKGSLVATPQGIRYETTDKEDAFSATLTELETFQVDYLNKNLRVQPRKGKGYDFTDPDGNADRLFVFHRDVDRARERLKKEG